QSLFSPRSTNFHEFLIGVPVRDHASAATAALRDYGKFRSLRPVFTVASPANRFHSGADHDAANAFLKASGMVAAAGRPLFARPSQTRASNPSKIGLSAQNPLYSARRLVSPQCRISASILRISSWVADARKRALASTIGMPTMPYPSRIARTLWPASRSSAWNALSIQ